jgi:hypothetical protein
VIVHIDIDTKGAFPLSEQQSRALLRFCRSVGADVFTVNFLFVKGEESERLAEEFYDRLAPFKAEQKLLECPYGNGFKHQDCWSLTDQTIDIIVNETHGNLLACNILNLPEDWLIYLGDYIILQASYEMEITLRLTDAQFAAFSQLGIPYSSGQPKWSGLPEFPVRTPPQRTSG